MSTIDLQQIEKYEENLRSGTWRLPCRGNNRQRKSLSSFHNSVIILNFIKERKILNDKPATLGNYLHQLHAFAEFLKEKDFEAVSKEDIVNYISLRQQKNKKSSVNAVKRQIKTFYKWINGGKTYPDSVDWLRSKDDFINLTPQELLTKEEIEKLIDTADSYRDKALVSMLWESGCRVSELLNLRIKDIEFDEYGVVLYVNGKTGRRQVRIVNSIPYLKLWLKQHPDKDNDEAFVWIIISKYHKWKTEIDKNGNGMKYGKQLHLAGLYRIIQQLGKKAGMKKRVFPHLLRHTRATELQEKLSAQNFCKYFGWSPTSAMPARYVHLSDKASDNEILIKEYGITPKNIDKIADIISKVCFNCGERNPTNYDFCMSCKFPLDKEVLKAKQQQLLSLITPEILENMIQQKVKELLAERIKT